MASLSVAFDAGLPQARWGPLFHVFRLEQRDVVFEWHPVPFPVRARPLLGDADVGVFVHPPDEPSVSAVAIDASPMVVVMAAGHPLADNVDLTVADVIEQPFPGGRGLDPDWVAFWTLDEQRGGPAERPDDDVTDAPQGLEVIAAGRAIGTVPIWMAGCLTHPGVVALPLRDGPPVITSLVWRTGDENPLVRRFVELAKAWTAEGRRNGQGP
ncbi:MAG TPA: LysR substrate-binding domain-containing protein [Thermoleophilaceae bacterium]|nr:LysR substrate-binding domain-containing protein [Thermoleophilaceae bacterium]